MSGSTLFAPVAGGHERIELSIARDLAKHAVYAAPGVVVVGALVQGTAGALGATLALAVVAINFLVAAAVLGRAARVSAGALMGASLLSFVVRLGVITGVGIAVKQIDAVHFATFGIVLVVTHLGLLFWELRHVSLSLAYPGLKPTASELQKEQA
jgi:hypothetical protein